MRDKTKAISLSQREKESRGEEKRSMMPAFAAGTPLRCPFLFAFISLQILSGLANDPSGAQNESKDVSHRASTSSAGLDIILICLAVVTIIAFGVFLFKLWQKKKREEQHARLLKLFEDDDELEVELGMRE